MGNSGMVNLGAKIWIVVGSLLTVVVAGGMIKHYINKRRTRKNAKVRNQQRPMQINSMENLIGKKPEEGYLFALQDGHLRGMTQSRSSSPASSYVLPPATTIVNWGDWKSIHSASSSVIDLPRSRDGSIISLPTMPKKPSPLRINPSDAPLNSRVSTASTFGGSYMPPRPPPRSVRSSRNPKAHSNWVSPLHVHFGKPTTPQSYISRPQSYLPQLQFPGQAKNALLVPTLAGSISGAINSEAASMVSSNAAAALEPVPQNSPTFDFNFFDSEVPTRSSKEPTPSLFPATSDDHLIFRGGAKGFKETSVPSPKFPQNLFGPISPSLDPNRYGEKVIIRASVVSKRSVSIYQPSVPHTPTETTPSQLYAESRAASSIYSTAESIIDTTSMSRPVSLSYQYSKSKTRSRSRSTSSKRPTSTHTLSRTQDSLRRHSRKLSIAENRRSRERDQLHYDPTSHHRNRSGSVQGRSVDFDRPRESPFSSAKVISHSASSSLSSTSIAGSPGQKVTEIGPEHIHRPADGSKSTLAVGIVDPDRLSVATTASKRGRSTSEASSVGFGEFYDAYYRQSVLAQSASQGTVNSNRGSGIVQDLHLAGVSVAISSNSGGKRPPPLRWVGAGRAVGETIVEVASPLPSPGVGMAGMFEALDGRI